tara:strand:- start:83 stop:292 length:210 start_codon:yes stop_codon:yes gene_type:complete
MAYSTIEQLRAARNQALLESDWAVLPDSPHGGEGFQKAIRLYRQELRDLPAKAMKEGVQNVSLPPSPFV